MIVPRKAPKRVRDQYSFYQSQALVTDDERLRVESEHNSPSAMRKSDEE